MTKSDLIDQLGNKWKLPKGRAEEIVNTVFHALEHALARGERVEIRGLGSFEVRSYGGYSGRNPRTGETVVVKPKRLPFFKVGKDLKERVNGAVEADEAPRRKNSAAGANGTTAATGAARPTRDGAHDSARDSDRPDARVDGSGLSEASPGLT